MTGSVLALLALIVLVYARTGSPLLSALVFATGFLPYLISGTLFSALVDRSSIRRLLVICNVLSGALTSVMAFPGTPVAALLVLAFALGLIRPVFLGARAATLPDVLPGGSFVPGRSLLRLVTQMTQIGGFALGGILMTVISPRGILAGNAGCFAAAALLLRLGTSERVPPSREPAPPSLLTDSVSGIREVMSIAPLRRILLIAWAVPALAVTPEALAVPYATGLSAGTVGAGVLLAALPSGTVIGEVMTNCAVSAERQVKIILPACVLTFVPLLCFAFHPGLPVAVTILFISGLGAAFHIGLDRILLGTAPAELRARTLSLQIAGLMFWQGMSYAAAGAAGQMASPSVVIPAAAMCGLLLAGQSYLAIQRSGDDRTWPLSWWQGERGKA
jgi:MFS family permease